MRTNAFSGAFSCMVTLATVQGNAQQPFDLDTTFRAATVASGDPLGVNSMIVLPDGDLILSGQVRFPWDTAPRSGCRLNSDGSLDLNFAQNPQMGGKLTPWNGRIYQRNGNGVRRSWLDGTLDTDYVTWNVGPYFVLGQGGDYHVYPDGRILMSGSHDLLDSIRGYVGSYELVWFNNSGYLDTTAQHRNCNGVIYRFEPQPDGKFVCSGWCTIYENQPVSQIFRVHADGALDTTFQTDFVWGEADDITVMSDGRILLSGALQRSGEADTLHFVRLMPDGSVDASFNSGLDVRELQLDQQSALISLFHTRLDDGRLVIHGGFDRVAGELRRGIAVLDSTGYLLSDAFAGNGCGDYDTGNFPVSHGTWGMARDPIGNWYIYGSYAGYDDGTTNDPQQRFVSRLHGLNVGVLEREQPLQLQVYPNPTSGLAQVQLREGVTRATLHVLDAQGRLVQEQEVQGNTYKLDLSDQGPGVYAVRVRTEQGRVGHKLVVLEP